MSTFLTLGVDLWTLTGYPTWWPSTDILIKNDPRPPRFDALARLLITIAE